MAPPEPRNAVDNRPRRADDRRMEDRLSALEQYVATMAVDLAVIKSNYATKEDVASLRTAMTTEFGKVDAEFGKVRAEMAAEFGKVDAEFGKVRTEMAAEFGRVRAEMAAESGKMRAEMASLEGRLFWRIITWMMSAMTLMTAGVYFIARYVH